MHCVQAEVPAQILLATGKDHYRKPERGMWDYFIEHGNEGKEPGMTSHLTVAIQYATYVHSNVVCLLPCTHFIVRVASIGSFSVCTTDCKPGAASL